MLTPEQIAALRDAVGRITDPINNFLIEDIARRISEAGQLTSTASYQVWQAQQIGMSQQEIKKELKKILKKSSAEIEKLLTQSAEVGYDFDIKRLPTTAAIPFDQNTTIQNIVNAAVKLALSDFTNLTQTKAIGFTDPYGNVVSLLDAYRSRMDFAFEQVFTGAADYNTAIRSACKDLANKGVQWIDYESGVHTSLEAAVRRNIMGGLGLMQEQISQVNHDEFGADGWEISAHGNSAPDHEPIQGKQYSDADYTALNSSLARRIGTLNCGHVAFPIVFGVSTPQYTEEQLQKFKEDNAAGITYQGCHYTGYQATQMQRRVERSIRNQKRRILVDEAVGDKEKLLTDQIKLRRLSEEYKRFSKAAGLRTQNERAMVAGFGRGQTSAYQKTVAKYSAVRYNKDGTIVVTDDWKDKGKTSLPREFRPNAVLETQTRYKNGIIQIDRTLYDESGIMRTQIHSGPHNRPDQHPFGKHGEHAHDYTWVLGKKNPDKTKRNIADEERIRHVDILGGEEND